MFRIGILGSENSHAMAFAKIFNGLDPNFEGSFPDCKVVAIGGHYPESSQKVFDECGLEFIAEKPEDMLGNVDAVMVTARNGKFHPEFARPFIEAGIPAFIDKPFANDGAEALALAKLAKSKNVPLVGGSSTKLVYDVTMLRNSFKNGLGGLLGGGVAAPLSFNNEYGGFYFYSSHLAEILMAIFGYDVKSVIAVEKNGNVTGIARYNDLDVTMHFNDGYYGYSAGMFGKKGSARREIDISLCYQHECQIFADMLRTGKMSHTYEELIAPVFLLNAIEKSYLNGGQEVPVIIPEV